MPIEYYESLQRSQELLTQIKEQKEREKKKTVKIFDAMSATNKFLKSMNSQPSTNVYNEILPDAFCKAIADYLLEIGLNQKDSNFNLFVQYFYDQFTNNKTDNYNDIDFDFILVQMSVFTKLSFINQELINRINELYIYNGPNLGYEHQPADYLKVRTDERIAS